MALTRVVTADRVSCRLVRLLVPTLNLHPHPFVLAPVVRAAVLTDLALSGALVDAGDELEVVTTPTGYPPADGLVSAVVAHPDRPVTAWLSNRAVGVHDVVAVLVAHGTLAHHGPLHHLRDTAPQVAAADLRRVHTAWKGRADTPSTAAVATLLSLVSGQGGVDLSRHCGDAAWLVDQLSDTLQSMAAAFSGGLRAGRMSGSTPGGMV